MKKFFGIMTVLAFLGISISAFAADKELVIKSTPQCEMCVKTIKKGLKKVDGVEKVDVNLEKSEVKVVFDDEDTNENEIKIALTKLGYKADDLKADAKAYDKLSDCCKLPEDRK